MTIIHHPLALEDADEVRCYLEGISDRLPGQFDRELNAALETALQNPRHFHPLAEDTRIRRANLIRMSYNVLYSPSDEQGILFVLAIRHNKRHPDYGVDRI